MFNVVLIFLVQHGTDKTLCNVGKEVPCNIEQEKVLCSDVLIRLGQHCTRKTLCNIALEAPDSIAQEKILFLVV